MILAIETATAACSVALIEAGTVVDFRHERVGRGHAERLIPMIAELHNGGRADRIVAGCGPGSFTGIRVGLAAAHGLALAWAVEASGYSTLALIAARHFATTDQGETVTVTLPAGHGEIFVQNFARHPFLALDKLVSIVPGDVAGRSQPTVIDAECEPDARHIIHLPDASLRLALRPIYGRDADAKRPS
jgi:tRNA threonylcarbamoyladenosine biosynthesis protein TsaB